MCRFISVKIASQITTKYIPISHQYFERQSIPMMTSKSTWASDLNDLDLQRLWKSLEPITTLRRTDWSMSWGFVIQCFGWFPLHIGQNIKFGFPFKVMLFDKMSRLEMWGWQIWKLTFAKALVSYISHDAATNSANHNRG